MERKARSDERRSERKDRLDEIRRKYGLYMGHFQKIPNFLSLMLKKMCRHIYWPTLSENGCNVKYNQYGVTLLQHLMNFALISFPHQQKGSTGVVKMAVSQQHVNFHDAVKHEEKIAGQFKNNILIKEVNTIQIPSIFFSCDHSFLSKIK